MTEHELTYMRALCNADDILAKYLGCMTPARQEIAKLKRETEHVAAMRSQQSSIRFEQGDRQTANDDPAIHSGSTGTTHTVVQSEPTQRSRSQAINRCTCGPTQPVDMLCPRHGVDA